MCVCASSIILFIRIIRPCFFKNAAAPNTPMNNANEPVGRRTRFINHTHAVYIYNVYTYLWTPSCFDRRRRPRVLSHIYMYIVCVCVYSFYYFLVFYSTCPAPPPHSFRANHLPSRHIYIYIYYVFKPFHARPAAAQLSFGEIILHTRVILYIYACYLYLVLYRCIYYYIMLYISGSVLCFSSIIARCRCFVLCAHTHAHLLICIHERHASRDPLASGRPLVYIIRYDMYQRPAGDRCCSSTRCI